MELKPPEKLKNQTYRIPIEVEAPVRVVYRLLSSGAHTTPPESLQALIDVRQRLAFLLAPYSQRWFSRQVDPIHVLRSFSSAWETGTTIPPFQGSLPPGGIPLYQEQVWRPAWLEVLPRGYRLHWTLEGCTFGVDPAPEPVELSGLGRPSSRGEDAVASIPFQETNEIFVVRSSLRERAKQKVRAARLKAALSKLRAEQLLYRYYKRYGVSETLDESGSVLSSSDEEEAAGPDQA